MKFGIVFANTGRMATPHGAVAFAQAAERNGIESLWTVEHVVVPAGYASAYPYDASGRMPGRDDASVPDPLIWLAFLASVTTTIRLATGILILPQRNPVVLAKEVASLDALSQGRVELGIGVGWLREEFEALGIPFEERGARTDDYIGALRALWGDGAASFDGPFTSFQDCISSPSPVGGSVPIHVGGHSDAAARRAGRLGDGFFPVEGDHTRLAELIDIAKTTAVKHGRNPDALEITSGGRGVIGSRALDEAAALAALGVSRVVLPAVLFKEDPDAQFAEYHDAVISKVG